MNLFRSEEHIDRWVGGRNPGATIPAAKLSELAHAWWSDRMAPDWQPRAREQNQEILDELGLTGSFWPGRIGILTAPRTARPSEGPRPWRPSVRTCPPDESRNLPAREVAVPRYRPL
jgi:hypothetical protein